MNTVNPIKILKAPDEQRQAVIALLQSGQLPVEDLPASFSNFFMAVDGDTIVGVIGLEQYEQYGLLRSMIVNKAYRNRNIASQLVQALEKHAAALEINVIYLLTETAPLYFERKGYQRIAREEVPEAIKASSEFSHVCPVSAIVMKKQPDKNQ